MISERNALIEECNRLKSECALITTSKEIEIKEAVDLAVTTLISERDALIGERNHLKSECTLITTSKEIEIKEVVDLAITKAKT